MQAQLNAAPRISENLKTNQKDAAPAAGFSAVDMGGGSGAMGAGVFNAKNGPKVTGAAPKAASAKTLNVSSSVMAARSISRTQPVYPSFARSARVEGTVEMHAVISTAGTITSLSVVSGPNVLRQAALDAVKTWRYKPYLLDNEPVEVETTVNVVFVLR
jgi:protein TonB